MAKKKANKKFSKDTQRMVLDMLRSEGAPAGVAVTFLAGSCNLSREEAARVFREYCAEEIAIHNRKPWWQRIFCG